MAKIKPGVPSLPNLKKDIITPYDKNLGSYEEPIKPLNRGNELAVSPNIDPIDNLSVGFSDIDGAVKYFFEQKLRPSVVMNGERISIPLMYGSPELWDSIQKNGMYRDKNGKILSPIIVYKRNSIDRNLTLGNKLDGNQIHKYLVYKAKYNRKNQYIPFGKISNVSPSEEMKLVAVPDYVTVTYNCILITDYVEQNNKIIEDINFFADAYWGEPNKFNFKANIQNYNQAIETTQGEDRIVKTSFSLTLNGYLINNNLVRQMAGAKKFYSKSVISLGTEVVSSTAENIMFRAKTSPKTMKPGQAPAGGSGQVQQTVDEALVAYLNTNKQITGAYETASSARFLNTYILQAPGSLPPTSLNSFSFFANGIYIPSTAIVSFQQVGSDCILTVNTTVLDYVFKPNYEFTAIGKFV